MDRVWTLRLAACVASILFSGAALAGSAVIGRPPLTANPGLGGPSTPTSPATPQQGGSAYPVRIACPADTDLFVDILPYRVPAGWTSTASGLALNSAAVGVFQGRQTLSCKYDSRNAANSFVSSLNHAVGLNSCVVAPDKKSFLCKPGTQ